MMRLEYARLGSSDLEVTKVGLGSWQFGTEGWGWEQDFSKRDALAAFKEAMDLGINFIDTAEVYGEGRSEELVGEAVKGHRDQFIIATKASGGHLREKDLLRACEGSLKRLDMATIDLYQVHWPNSYVPLTETMGALDKLAQQGKIRYVGVSNFPASMLQEAQAHLKGKIVSNQVRYNLLQREIEREILPYCREEEITIIAYSPLAQGFLTGKYDQQNLPQDEVRQRNPLFRNEGNLRQALGVVNALGEVARTHRKTPAQVALRWLIEQPGVVTIPGAKRPQQVEENAGAMGWQLTEQEWQKLNSLTTEFELSYF
jgi:myo-inositol catabolism protein IolS